MASRSGPSEVVAHYVNIDGASADSPPAGVPTLALWAGAAPPIGSIVGAVNVTLDGQEHIQAATSPEPLAEMYQFFNDRLPATTDVLREPPGQVSISGQVNYFPGNEGLAGARLEIWEVDGATGLHKRKRPVFTRMIDGSGDWGPIDEVKSDDHAAITVVRSNELHGHLGAGSDVLEVAGTNVIDPITASCATVGSGTAAFFAFDDNSDGVSDVTSIPIPFAFLSAADRYIPSDPAGSLAVTLVPRGDRAARTVNVPNHPSTQSRVVVQLNDFD